MTSHPLAGLFVRGTGWLAMPAFCPRRFSHPIISSSTQCTVEARCLFGDVRRTVADDEIAIGSVA
jgi:hypothetical protein